MKSSILALGVLLFPAAAFADHRYDSGGAEVEVAISASVGQPPRPSPRHIWRPGHWLARGEHRLWIAGSWGVPPDRHHVWVPARYEQRAGGWIYVEGHWRRTGGPVPVVTRQPVPPAPGYVWVEGHWRGHGRHATWVPAHWAAPAYRAAYRDEDHDHHDRRHHRGHRRHHRKHHRHHHRRQ